MSDPMNNPADSSFLWSSIIGQSDAIDKILRALRSEEGSHAWLFAGPRGVGKWTTAKVMAAALNCQEDGCGRCVSCGKIMREIHPDIFLIEPEGNFILIEQIEQLIQSVSLKNYEGKIKVIVIDEADRFTPEAANALLKTLEEPPVDVVFVLVSSNPEAVLPTIISRCRQVQFRPIPAQEMISFLVNRYSLGYDEAALATRLSGGILGAAVSFAASPSKRERRKTVLGIAQSADRADLARLSFIAEELIREIKKPLDELKAANKKEIAELKEQYDAKDAPVRTIKRIEQRQKRELGKEEHQGFEDVLTILTSWFRDIILLKETGREDLLNNQDHLLAVKEHVDLFSSEDMNRCLQIIEETRQYSRFNVNMQLAFEEMLFRIHDVLAVQANPYFVP
ncbi:DNA polymerase III subunit delta' [Candidatus Aquicultor sp.]